MKSLYVAILIAMLVTLSLSLLVFLLISNHMDEKYMYPVFEAMDELELESALSALKTGGPQGVSSYMERLNQLFGTSHYLLDSEGVDIASGKRHTELLPAAPTSKSRGFVNGRYIVTHRSDDGAHWFVAVDPRQPRWSTFLPYYLLVLAVTGVLCWLAAVRIVSPIRRIAASMVRLGKGELSARVSLRRQDEIGELACSFNQMAAQLQRLLTSERRLLEDISHELRSPLTRLKFAVRLARTDADRGAALDRVERETNRITSLVSEIVEMTRVENDSLSRKTENVDLDELIEETVSDGQLEADFRNCKIRVEGQLSCEVSGDQELLRRAVENVLRNAIRHSPERARIDVILERNAEFATITVRDHGPGVPEEFLTQILEPFFRVDEAREVTSGGVGLGLSIAKRAVQLHEGTIVAENAAPGLRVRITIPLNTVGFDVRTTPNGAGAMPDRGA